MQYPIYSLRMQLVGNVCGPFFSSSSSSHSSPLLWQAPAVQPAWSCTAGPTTPSGCTGAPWALRSTHTRWSCTGREPTTAAWQQLAAGTATSRRKPAGTSTRWWQPRWDRTGSKSASVNPGHTQVRPRVRILWFITHMVSGCGINGLNSGHVLSSLPREQRWHGWVWILS